MQFYWLIPLLTFLVERTLCQLPDVDKVYEPNPPATHRVTMIVEYTPAGETKPKKGEISIAIYGTVVPKTAKNFVDIAKGVKVQIKGREGELLDVSYRDTIFHRIENGELIEGGNVLPNVGSFSVHGPRFTDENFDLKHDRAGRVSMANSGKDSNASQFFIVTHPDGLELLDGKHVVFGQVVAGLDVLLLIQQVETIESKPIHDVKIVGSVVDTLKLGNRDLLHERYVKDLQKFRDGDKTLGVTLKTAMGKTAGSTTVAKGQDGVLFFAPKYLYVGGSIIAVLYLIKKRRSIFTRSSAKVVSVRNS